MNEMTSLKEMLDSSSDELKSTLHHELNQRGFVGEAFQANLILKSVKKVHEKMKSILNSNHFILSSSNISSSSLPSLQAGFEPPVIITESTVPVLVETRDDNSECGNIVEGRRKIHCWEENYTMYPITSICQG